MSLPPVLVKTLGYQAKAYLSNHNTVFAKHCAFEKAANLSRGLIWWPRPLVSDDAKHLTPGAFVCMCVSAYVWHTEKRAGPTSLAGRSLMVDEWHSRCLSIFSSKHPWQAGRRGSWEGEVVQRWTVDFQFNSISWKVKHLWRWPCQTQLWQPQHCGK